MVGGSLLHGLPLVGGSFQSPSFDIYIYIYISKDGL